MAYLDTLSKFGGEEVKDLSMVKNTQMVFRQAEAPVGWTRKIDINDTGLRVVNGETGAQLDAGVKVFTSVMANTLISGIVKYTTPTGAVTETTTTSTSSPSISHSIDAHTVSVSELPSHIHGYSTNGHYHYLSDQYPDPITTIDSGGKGGGGGGVCFTPESVVVMEDGTTKPICEVCIGERVMNADRTDINTVVFIEKNINTFGLYSPKGEEPFATPDHPLWVDGILSAPINNAKEWLGPVKKLYVPISEKRIGEEVFNLWLDGDGTYIINGYGTHSVMYDGGALRKGCEYGFITHAEAMKFMVDNPTYGAFIANRIAGKINSKLLYRFLAYAMRTPETIANRIVHTVFDAINFFNDIRKSIK